MALFDPKAILFDFEQNRRQLIDELTVLARTLSTRFSLPPHLTPDDIAQDVLAICCQKLRAGSFRGESDIRTFVYRITINVCLSAQRQYRTSERVLAKLTREKMTEEHPWDRIASVDTIRLACRIIGELPQKCRDLWRMMLVEGKNYREVAEVLNVQEVTVRERMSNCRRRARDLREKLDRDQHG